MEGQAVSYYWDLCVLFGKDRATGKDAQTAADLIEELHEDREEQGDTSILGEDLEDMHIESQPNTLGSTPSEECSSAQRKRKRSNSIDPLVSSIKRRPRSLAPKSSKRQIASLLCLEWKGIGRNFVKTLMGR